VFRNSLARLVTWSLLFFPILCHSWNHFIGIFKLYFIAYQTLSSRETSYLFSMLSLAPKPGELHLSGFTCFLFPRLKLMLFQLLSLFFGTHSLNMLSILIAYYEYLSITIWKLTFSHLVIPPKIPLHPIICWWIMHCILTMRLPNPCTRFSTDLDSFWGYGRYRS